MKIAVAQLGARRHYAVPRMLHEAGMLERLFTDAYVGNKPWLEFALRHTPAKYRHRMSPRWLGRKNDTIPADKVRSFDFLGIVYRRRLNSAADNIAARRVHAWAGKKFGKRIVRAGFANASAVWSFNGTALEMFESAKERGLRCILEQTIPPVRVQNHLLRSEVERWPGWQLGLELSLTESCNECRLAAEWNLADMIVCGSQFVVDGIAECGGPVEKCRIVPYGVDLASFPASSPRRRAPGDRLRVLFAGEVGLRKGAPWLLEALRQIGPDLVEARFAGRLSLSRDKLAPYAELATFLGAVPRSRMAELFAWADLFVLPSICEGSATVVYEAVASGVPVICTPNTGALQSPAVTIVPLGDLATLAEAIAGHAREDAAAPIASDTRRQYGLEGYAERLLAAVRTVEPACRPSAA